jgi:hypothetical protein
MIMSNQTERFLRTEELYRQIIGLMPEAVLKTVSETYVRGLLDAVLAQGKIEGRLSALPSAYGEGRARGLPDGLIEGWQRVVDSV